MARGCHAWPYLGVCFFCAPAKPHRLCPRAALAGPAAASFPSWTAGPAPISAQGGRAPADGERQTYQQAVRRGRVGGCPRARRQAQLAHQARARLPEREHGRLGVDDGVAAERAEEIAIVGWVRHARLVAEKGARVHQISRVHLPSTADAAPRLRRLREA
eukprot:scaffold14787_cov82-Isochrysis_galbana.AAC.2